MWEEGVLLVVVVHERKVTQALNHELLLALEVGLEVHISLLLFYSPKQITIPLSTSDGGTYVPTIQPEGGKLEIFGKRHS